MGEGNNSFCKVCDEPHPLLVKDMLDHATKADIDAVDSATGDTAFHYTCFHDQPDCAEALVRAGCDTTVRSNNGEPVAVEVPGSDIGEVDPAAHVLARRPGWRAPGPA